MQLLLKSYRISHFFFKKKLRLLSRIIDGINYLIFNSYVPGQCEIGEKTKLGKGGIGLVIHERTVIGKNCIIGQGITIGGRSKYKEVPVIGDNVYLGAGCRILGPIKIGHDVVIGPNAVIIEDVPSNSVAVGVPGRIVKTGIKMNEMH